MRLSDLQLKEIVNISNGKRIGIIIDVIIDEKGYIKNLVMMNIVYHGVKLLK